MSNIEQLIYKIMSGSDCGSKEPVLIDIGDNYAIAIKSGSNTPNSTIGDTIRRVYTAGAMPVAMQYSIHSPQELVQSAAQKIGDYTNRLGLPVVGGSLEFSSQNANEHKINYLVVGVAKHSELISTNSVLPGMVIIQVGVAARQSEIEQDDPYYENMLMTSVVKAIREGKIVAATDMGTKGIVCAASRLVLNTSYGIELDIANEDVLTTLRKNSLLIAVEYDVAESVVFEMVNSGLVAAKIGSINESSMLRVIKNHRCEAEIPLQSITSAGVGKSLFVEKERPAWIGENEKFDLLSIPEPSKLTTPMSYNDVLLRLLESTNIASKEWIFSQFDSHQGTVSAVPPGFDASVLSIKGSSKAIVINVYENERASRLDPRTGGKIAAAEVLRNCICTGAKPVAISALIDSVTPSAVEFEEGIREVCADFNIVNNFTVGTHTSVGAVGVLDDIKKNVTPYFKKEGDAIFLLGETRDEIGFSEYLKVIHGKEDGKSAVLNIKREYALQVCFLEAVHNGLIESGHDCSGGGLAVALAECCVLKFDSPIGASVEYDCGLRADRLLFSETQSRIIVSVKAENREAFTKHVLHYHVPLEEIGVTGGESLSVNSEINIDLLTIRDSYFNSIRNSQ